MIFFFGLCLDDLHAVFQASFSSGILKNSPVKWHNCKSFNFYVVQITRKTLTDGHFRASSNRGFSSLSKCCLIFSFTQRQNFQKYNVEETVKNIMLLWQFSLYIHVKCIPFFPTANLWGKNGLTSHCPLMLNTISANQLTIFDSYLRSPWIQSPTYSWQ